jgi:hypothetical protein
LHQKDPEWGPGVGRTRHANALTMVGVGMDDAWRANEFPRYPYAIIILQYQVICEPKTIIYIARLAYWAHPERGLADRR